MVHLSLMDPIKSAYIVVSSSPAFVRTARSLTWWLIWITAVLVTPSHHLLCSSWASRWMIKHREDSRISSIIFFVKLSWFNNDLFSAWLPTGMIYWLVSENICSEVLSSPEVKLRPIVGKRVSTSFWDVSKWTRIERVTLLTSVRSGNCYLVVICFEKDWRFNMNYCRWEINL